MTHAVGGGFAVDAMQEFLFVEEEIAAQHALAVQLLEEIAGGDGHLAEGLVWIARFPVGKSFAGFGEFLLVEQPKTRANFRHIGECRRLQVSLGTRMRETRGQQEKRWQAEGSPTDGSTS